MENTNTGKILYGDIISGKEIATSEPIELISDGEIRDILQRYAPILHEAISQAESFTYKLWGDKFANAVPMTAREVELWDGLYGVKERILEAAQAGKLFVPGSDLPDDKLLLPPIESLKPSDFSRAVKAKDEQKDFRVNLDEVIHTSIEPFDPEGMQLFMKPHACFGGRGGPGSLYNAFIAEDVYVQDRYGRWAVDQIPGTGVHSWGGGPVFSPFNAGGADIWFNTRVEPEKKNSLAISVERPDYIMMSAKINHPDQLNDLPIPSEPKPRLFFWQLKRFVRDLGLGSSKGETSLLPK